MTKGPGPKAPTGQTGRRGGSRRGGSRGGFLASGAGLILIKLLNAFLGFATVTVFARFLPPEDYGLYVLVLTVAQFLALPLQMGLPVILTREISIAQAQGRPALILGVRAWTRRIVLVGTLIVGALVIGCYAVVVAAGWPILRDFSWPIVLLVVVLIPVIAEMKRVMGILNGYRKPAQSRMPDGIIRPVLLLLIGGLGLWANWFAATGLLVVYLVSALLAALGGWALVRRSEASGPPYEGPAEFNVAHWRKSLWPLTLFAAAGTIKTYSDVLMLGAMDTSEAVAFYRVASQIAGIALLADVAVNAVLGPHMAALNATKEHDRMQGLAVRGSRIAFGVTILFVCLLLLMGRGGFVLLLGEDYGPVYTLAVCLSLGMSANAVFGGTTMMLNMTGREKSSSNYAISTAVGNICLNLLLIPFLGVFGAVIATILTNVLMQVLSWRRLKDDLGIRTDAFARLRS
jgi:O-antigen/teichoic acid export membrane protein